MPPPPQLYDSLGPTGRRLSRVPRYALLIAQLPPHRFERLVTEAATIWEVYTQGPESVLATGLKPSLARNIGVPKNGRAPQDVDFQEFQILRACDVLGAIAFEMFARGSKPRFIERETRDLKTAAVNRMATAGAAKDFFGDPITKQDLFADLKAVFAMDSHELKYFIFTAQDREIRWTDITTQAFFAALWASRWPTDLEQLHSWLPDPWNDTNEVYLEFWRMVAEMPDEAILASGSPHGREHWEAALSPLFNGILRDDNGEVIRSTELIYRSWERMKDTAAGKEFRNEFARLLKTSDIARGVLQAADGSSQFVSRLEQQPKHPSELKMAPYLLHRCCVTNQHFELFDSRHRMFQPPADNASDRVVNVSWYDAWCFAAWLDTFSVKAILYRAALATQSQILDRCSCFGVFSQDSEISPKIKRDLYFGRLVTTCDTFCRRGSECELHRHSNGWEWRQDLERGIPMDPERFFHRMLRGGSWCRRFSAIPSGRSKGIGFRIAAVCAE